MNEIGLSAFTDVHYVVAARVPDTPTSFSLVISTEISIEFVWPEPYNGGSPITYYKIYW
jgi:hypothetical protein